jgi:Na+-transporting NADH:ubiquinone oxidoreductase subunit C
MGCCPKNSLIMNRDSNSYTFIFATIMVLVVASTLAFTASSLKSLQADNVRKEKMQNILSTIGIQTDREKAERLYKNYIKGTLALDYLGNIDKTVDAFQIKLNSEIKKTCKPAALPTL